MAGRLLLLKFTEDFGSEYQSPLQKERATYYQ